MGADANCDHLPKMDHKLFLWWLSVLVLLAYNFQATQEVNASSSDHKKDKKKRKNDKKHKKKRRRRKKVREAIDALVESKATSRMFEGFDGLASAEDNGSQDAEFASYFTENVKNIGKLCNYFRRHHLFTCFLDINGGWEYSGAKVKYHVSFGIMGIAVIMKPVEGAVLLANCSGFHNYRTKGCKKLTFRKDNLHNRFYVAKTPISEVSWQFYHLLSRCEFWHPNYVYQKFRLFPMVLDIANEKGKTLTAKHNALIFEYFADSCTYYDLFDILRKEFPNDAHIVQQYEIRYLYLYAFWATVLCINGFEHGDFHGGNVMVDLTKLRTNFGELEDIGLNHIYPIDLDTMKYPDTIENVEPDLQERLKLEQILRPDSVAIGIAIEVFLESTGDNVALNEYVNSDMFQENCFEDIIRRTCTQPVQEKSLKIALQYIYDYDKKNEMNALQQLFPPDEVDEFKFKC